MKLVLLGTGGGPIPTPFRAAPAQALLVGDALLVIDCGTGTARQLALAGLNLREMSHLFLTHHHIDHSADLGVLPILSWIMGRRDEISVYGPPPLTVALEHLIDGYEEDLRHRTISSGRPKFRPLLKIAEVEGRADVVETDTFKVCATNVCHPPLEVALAYRIETEEGIVVVSGDTRPCDELVSLAEGADVLVHEVVHPSAITALEKSLNAPTIRRHMESSHTMLSDVGAIAERAGVKTLVLSHLAPHHGLSDQEWREGAQEGFRGEVIVGHDLLELDLLEHNPRRKRSVRQC